LSIEIIKDFIVIDPETQPRNVAAWTPVVVDILQGCVAFEDSAVSLIFAHEGERTSHDSSVERQKWKGPSC
jgi:hypothetical protein